MARKRCPAATDKRRRRHATARADHGPRERWQHDGRELMMTGTSGILAVRATESHRLDYLLTAGHITQREREAGLKLATDFHHANLEPSVTSRYNPIRAPFNPFNGWDERSDDEEAAYQRWRHALRALGPLGNAVVSLACQELAVGDATLKQAKQGLQRLADWYRLPNARTQARAAERIV